MDSIKEYLPYYLGCTYYTPNSEGELNAITLPWVIDMIDDGKKVQLVLRKLSSITEQEAIELTRLVVHENEFCEVSTYRDTQGDGDLIVDWKFGTYNATGEKAWSAEQFNYLLKQGFWLFGQEAFEKGLIIEKTQ